MFVGAEGTRVGGVSGAPIQAGGRRGRHVAPVARGEAFCGTADGAVEFPMQFTWSSGGVPHLG